MQTLVQVAAILRSHSHRPLGSSAIERPKRRDFTAKRHVYERAIEEVSRPTALFTLNSIDGNLFLFCKYYAEADKVKHDHASYWADFIGISAVDPLALSLADVSTIIELKPDDRLVLDRDPAGPVFLLIKGDLKVVKQSQNGHEIWLASFPAPAIVGELSAILGTPRTSDVIADSNVTVLSIPRVVFNDAAQTDVKLARALNVELARRVKATSDKLAELYSVSVMGRLHYELVRMGDQDPKDDEVYRIESMINVSEISARIHATRESTSRALSRLKQMGIVNIEDDRVTVIAPRLE